MLHLKLTRRLALGAVAAASLPAIFSPKNAHAENWPSKPMTMVVPWLAGGPSDFIARQLQKDLQAALGQPLIVENLGGVSGALGVQKALRSTDGHTFLLGSPPDLIIPPLSVAAVKYKPQELRMVAQLVKAPLVLLARHDLAANNMDELVALADKVRAAKGAPLTMANNGPGSLFHLVGEQFSQQARIELLHIPYRGSAASMADLMGGQVDLMFTVFAGPVPPSIASGKIKAIGLTTPKPHDLFPKLAALAAHPRLRGFEFDSWAGIQVTRSTPDEVATRLNKAAYQALANPLIRKALEETGNQVVAPASLPELEKIYISEIGRYTSIAKSINFQPQQ